MQIEDVNNIHLESDFYFAIAVGIDGNFSHSSIVYKWNNEIKTLDFYLGKIRSSLSYGDLGHKGFVYVKYNKEQITDDFAIQIPSLCELVIEKNSVLNFGITFNKSKFDEEGYLILQDGDFGLTCSTFILSIFESVGITLVDQNSWNERQTDIDWQEYVLAFFKEKNAENPNKVFEEIIKHFESNIGCFRFRPEEVASSSSSNIIPAEFDFCAQHGEQIIFAIERGIDEFKLKYYA